MEEEDIQVSNYRGDTISFSGASGLKEKMKVRYEVQVTRSMITSVGRSDLYAAIMVNTNERNGKL
jgi:hypothetical protein